MKFKDDEVKNDVVFEGGDTDSSNSAKQREMEESEFENVDNIEVSYLEAFFGGFWNRNVYFCRYIILLIFILWTAYATGKASSIKPQMKQELILPEKNYLIKAERDLEKNFATMLIVTHDENEVAFFFGVN